MARQVGGRAQSLRRREEEMNNSDPRCETCGAEITTGLMAAFCPLAERCEFWTPESADVINELRASLRAELERG